MGRRGEGEGERGYRASRRSDPGVKYRTGRDIQCPADRQARRQADREPQTSIIATNAVHVQPHPRVMDYNTRTVPTKTPYHGRLHNDTRDIVYQVHDNSLYPSTVASRAHYLE